MRKGIKRLVILGTLLTMMLAMSASAVFAWQDYETNVFNVKVDVGENHVIHVTETIRVDFHSAKHGLYRNIPYQPKFYKIKNIQVPKNDFDVSTETENNVAQKVIKIGSADKTVTGSKTYEISYDLVCYQDESPNLDYLSLDVLPTNWETSIDAVNITVKMPKTMNWDKLKVYAGSYGYQNIVKDRYMGVEYSIDKNKNAIRIEGQNLIRGEGITLSADLPEGYWVDPANYDWLMYLLYGILIGIPLLMCLLWLLFGRDPQVIKTVEFYPPEGMTPAEIGYVIDGAIDNKDIVSMITYYASKGYLSISEYEAMKTSKFMVKKLKDIDPSEKRFAKTFFHAIFESGDKIKLDELPEDFGDLYWATRDQLKGWYTGEKSLFTKNSRICRGAGAVLMFVPPVVSILLSALLSLEFLTLIGLIPLLILLMAGLLMVMITFDRRDSMKKGKRTALFVIGTVLIALGILIAAGLTAYQLKSEILALLIIASTIVTYAFVLLMKSRTKQSAQLQGKILGFKDFIEAAELEKLKMLVEENPEYFYDIMPYAYVMGLSDKWAKNFENIPTNPPSWYHGGNSSMVFSTLWYSHMITNCSRNFSSGIMNVTSVDTGGGSIGGGFGGGGFSGGGFGGGGGGAW
ncbi:DUF2207 domain-containing protein [Emergencia sp.]|uniref:DUF2207 domain-containing protein n=1 Tax=Emergencia sp. TaxID=1926557 RepID=UPI003AF095A1